MVREKWGQCKSLRKLSESSKGKRQGQTALAFGYQGSFQEVYRGSDHKDHTWKFTPRRSEKAEIIFIQKKIRGLGWYAW